jgi:hypothetical protein
MDHDAILFVLMADPGDKGGLVIAGVILAGGALLFLLIQCKEGYERWREKDRFMAVAREANATVVGHQVGSTSSSGGRYGRSGKFLVPIVRFTDAGGREWTGTMNMISPNERRKGEKLTVLYEPADPRNVWEGPPSMKFVIINIAVPTAVLALGCGLIFFFGRQRATDD